DRADEMRVATPRFEELARSAAEQAGGHLVKPRGEGDSVFCVFARASDAVAAALAIQQGTRDLPFRIRVAIHTGETDLLDGDYYGPVVNRCARLRGVANPGQILLSHATAQLAVGSLPPEACLRDLGAHRLRDLLRPERVSELRHPSLEPSEDAIRSLDFHPNNLPVQLTSFVGRDAELVKLRVLLEKTRLLTLTGSGGAGKTRLSLQLAAEVLEEYPDGVWQVDLTPVRDPRLVPKAFRLALKLEEAPGGDDVKVVVDSLQTSRALLLIDNCEHLIGHVAHLASSLLRLCPSLQILATSREALHIQGEQVYQVPSLTCPASGADLTPEELLQYEAPRLFLERAASRLPTFRITEANQQAVATLCRRLDGIPLAIEHVASNVPVMSPQAILQRWREGFPVLATDQREEIERHQTLRASIDWSYDMLSEPERRLFARLAIFDGAWTLSAAESVCADDEVARAEVMGILHKLVDKCLVVTDQDTYGETYFWFLETLRGYAGERMQELRPALQNRLVVWATDLVDEALEQTRGKDQARWFHLLEMLYPSLRLALDLSKDEAGLWLLVSGLRVFWFRRGHIAEGRGWIVRCIRSGLLEPRELAEAQNLLGAFAYKQKDYQVAREAYRESLRQYELIGDQDSIGPVIHNLGILASDMGQLEEAVDWLQKAVGMFRSAGNRVHEAAALMNLGICELSRDAPEVALKRLEECLAIYEDVGSATQLATTLLNMAQALERCGRGVEGLAARTRCFQLWREAPDCSLLGAALSGLATRLSEHDDFTSAASLLGASEAVMKRVAVALSVSEQERHDRCLEACRAALGAQYAQTFRTGSRMSDTAAIEHAIRLCNVLTENQPIP
ncbi:MAG TPA: tetratricopeptide repeat protein, partial [Fimbriimonadaceae bacterium]|nr:tetratricopeptide repeat protein [Fimbriimonadaceae bacterium]